MNSDRQNIADSPLWAIGTLVGWIVCLAASVLGLRLGYPQPPAADESDMPPTQMVDVQLTPQAAVPPEAAPPPPTPQAVAPSVEPPAPAPAPVNVPDKPAVAAVAQASPGLAFALPTEGLTRVVDGAQAGYTRAPLASTGPAGGRGTGPPGAPAAPPKPVAPSSPPVVARLTFGEGEGRQPPPVYPREAVLARQEGTVGLRFTVGEDGRVLTVEVTAPSRWPLLNQAASRAVRDTWRFNPGPRRIYEVPIEFQLSH